MAYDNLAQVAVAIDKKINSPRASNSNNFSANDIAPVVNEVKRAIEKDVVSLSQAIKKTQIHSRTYIQNSILDEEIMKDIVNNLYNIYTGYIVTALQLDRYIGNGRTVKNLIGTVATENFSSAHEYINESMNFALGRPVTMARPSKKSTSDDETDIKITDKKDTSTINKQSAAITQGAIKASENKTIDFPVGKVISISLNTGLIVDSAVVETGSKITDSGLDKGKKTDYIKDDKVIGTTNTKTSVNVSNTKIDTSNKATSTNDAKDVSVTLTVYLHPTPIPDIVAEQFVTYNFEANVKSRYMSYSAGEISFWKDWVFQQDILKKRRKAIVADKSGVLAEMFEKQTNALVKANLKMAELGYNNSKNIANTILVFEKNSFKRWCDQHGVKFETDRDPLIPISDLVKSDREKFFAKTFSMMVVLVDTMYDRVEFYYHGIPYHGVYTFKQLQNNNNQKVDIKDLAKFFAVGSAPKF